MLFILIRDPGLPVNLELIWLLFSVSLPLQGKKCLARKAQFSHGADGLVFLFPPCVQFVTLSCLTYSPPSVHTLPSAFGKMCKVLSE